mgnify:CR=1 FL=1
MEHESIAHKDWDDTRKLLVLYEIVHRDLKPSNILIDKYLHPKVGDFGLSKIIHTNKQSMTTQSLIGHKGTCAYMAPEIWAENPKYSETSDVYPFGMIMYEVVTNEQPFFGMKGRSNLVNVLKLVLIFSKLIKS